MRGYFVTATDTEVGKTAIACGLARLLATHGHDVGVSKPVQSGALADDPAGDAMLLRAAADASDAPHDVCPYSFAAPLAPLVASQLESRPVVADVILESIGELARRHDLLVVEGAGGLLVPVGEDWTIADLAGWLGLPLVLVARAGLGTVNHTLLTLEAARARGLESPGRAERPLGGDRYERRHEPRADRALRRRGRLQRALARGMAPASRSPNTSRRTSTRHRCWP